MSTEAPKPMTPSEYSPESKPVSPEVRKELDQLKAAILQDKAQEAANTIVAIATKNNGEVPDAYIASIVEHLSGYEEEALKKFLEGDTRTAKLGKLLGELAKQVSGPAAPEMSAASPVGQILNTIDKVAAKVKVGDILDKIPNDAAKALAKSMIGNNPSFIRNVLIGVAIKFVEGFAIRIRSFNPDLAKTFGSAIDLRIMRLGLKGRNSDGTYVKDSDADIYRRGYLKVAATARTSNALPATLQAAKDILTPPQNQITASETKPTDKKPETPAAKAPASETVAGDAKKSTEKTA